MQKFIQHLLHLVGNENLRRKWENISDTQAYRALFLSFATLTSVIVGVTVQVFVSNYALAAVAATASLPILLPLSIILVERLQRKMTYSGTKPELLSQRKVLEYDYEQAIRRIKNLGLPKEKEEKLMIEQLKDLERKLSELQTKQLN